MELDKLQRLIGIPSPAIKAEVDAKITEVLTVLSERYGDIKRPTVLYDLKGHTAGYAINGDTIRLNLDLLYDDKHHDDMLNDTLPHEVAHIVVHQLFPKAKAHGYQWASVMHTLGLPATRCHSYDTKAARVRSRPFTYDCGCMTHKVTKTLHDRMQRGRQYTCNKCGRVLRKVDDDEH